MKYFEFYLKALKIYFTFKTENFTQTFTDINVTTTTNNNKIKK